MGGMQPQVLSYGGSFLLLLSVVGFIEGSRERQYEATVSRLKGTVIAKGIRALRLGYVYGVTHGGDRFAADRTDSLYVWPPPQRTTAIGLAGTACDRVVVHPQR